jgi:hypothetical protein
MNNQTQKELIMAINALEWAVSNAKIIRDFPKDDVVKYANKTIGFCEDTIKACKEALAQPTQEHNEVEDYPSKEEVLNKIFDAVYAQYPKKKWQDLSDDDVKAIEEVLGIDKVYIRAVERTLKEKNT